MKKIKIKAYDLLLDDEMETVDDRFDDKDLCIRSQPHDPDDYYEDYDEDLDDIFENIRDNMED